MEKNYYYLIFIIFLLFFIPQILTLCINEKCDDLCKTCSRPCDPNACTSCFPRSFKRSLEYEDSEFSCSRKCSQSYSLPIKGQRYRYCNISQSINLLQSYHRFQNSRIQNLVDVDDESESSFWKLFIIFTIIFFFFIVAVILAYFFCFKKLNSNRHNSLAQELIQKELEVEGVPEKCSIKNNNIEYFNVETPPVSTYKHLIIVTNINEISVAEQCSAGYFSKVYKGRFQDKTVAIKIAGNNGRNEIYKELKIYDKVSHPNILPALAVYFGVKNMLLMPFRIFNLSQYFVKYGSEIHISQLLQYSIQIADGMEYLHSLNIIHCDLKIDNILIKDSAGKLIEISDFGCAVDLTDEVSPYCIGTVSHAAYETLKNYLECQGNNEPTSKLFCSKRSDVWSFAVTIWQIFQKSSKIPGNFQTAKTIVKNLEIGTTLEKPMLMPDYIWRYILLKCFDLVPSTRPRMAEILESLKIFQHKNFGSI